MTAVTLQDLQRNPLELLRRAVRGHETIRFDTEDGDAFLLNGEEYRGMQETLYLMAHPKTMQEIMEAMNEDRSAGEVYDPDAAW